MTTTQQRLERFLALPPEEREKKLRADLRGLLTRVYHEAVYARAAAAQVDATANEVRTAAQLEWLASALSGIDREETA